MKREWALQDAKNRFSEVINHALQEGPQIVTRRGDETAVLLSMRDYRELAAPDGNLVDFFRSSPLVGVDLQFKRAADYGREVNL